LSHFIFPFVRYDERCELYQVLSTVSKGRTRAERETFLNNWVDENHSAAHSTVHRGEIVTMKISFVRTVLIAAAVSAGAFAQMPDQAPIDKALLAAPGNLKAGATVIRWKADFTYDTLKKGTNRLV
jgi:hypothetical protein